MCIKFHLGIGPFSLSSTLPFPLQIILKARAGITEEPAEEAKHSPLGVSDHKFTHNVGKTLRVYSTYSYQISTVARIYIATWNADNYLTGGKLICESNY